MSESDLKHEWQYRYQGRLGMICEDRDPTPTERNLARRCANKAILDLAAAEAKLETV